MHASLNTHQCMLFFLRLAVALVWLYNGLFLKVLFVDPEQLSLMNEAAPFGWSAGRALGILGLAETGLAIWIASGWRYLWAMGLQTIGVVLLNLGGILFGGYADPAGLLIGNLPIVMCGLIGMSFGSGRWRSVMNKEKS